MYWQKSKIATALSRMARAVGLLFFAYLCWRMVQLTLKYTDFQPLTGFLFWKVRAYKLLHWRLAFYIHVFSSIWVLLLGIPQFVPLLQRKPWLRWHRTIGIGYVFTVLALAGPSGLWMAFYALGGRPTQISFTLLALLWMGFTALGWHYARKHKLKQHRAWMIRSYALTLAAITQRVYVSLADGIFNTPKLPTYLVVGWLSWTLNLLVAEWVIRSKTNLS